MTYTPFAINLERIQRARNLSNAAIARMAQVHKSMVGQWKKPLEAGGSWPSALSVINLATSLGIGTDDLLREPEPGDVPELVRLRQIVPRLRPQDRAALVATAEAWLGRPSIPDELSAA